MLIFYINYKVSIFNFKRIKDAKTAKYKNLLKSTKVFSWNGLMLSTQANGIKGKEIKSEG